MNEESPRVFVYGTLLEGYANHRHFLKGKSSLLGCATMKGFLYHLPDGYPAMVEGEGWVKGQVFELFNLRILEEIDVLEGFGEGRDDNLYERVKRAVNVDNGAPLNCWVYLYRDAETAGAKGTLVPGGDWDSFMRGRVAWSGLNARDCIM
jgi:gamma-glutamylcyclotransferase (GGCT)/AIG2-like uncharacterized protein YtfP